MVSVDIEKADYVEIFYNTYTRRLLIAIIFVLVAHTVVIASASQLEGDGFDSQNLLLSFVPKTFQQNSSGVESTKWKGNK